MTGSGNFPPGRALRPEVRMNKEQEEAVMKRLAAEELEPLMKVYGTCCGQGTTVAINGPVLLRLLAMASRLVEVESALNYLHRECPMSTSDYEPGALLLLAKQLGWTSPTQKQAQEAGSMAGRDDCEAYEKEGIQL